MATTMSPITFFAVAVGDEAMGYAILRDGVRPVGSTSVGNEVTPYWLPIRCAWCPDVSPVGG
jgi:hypothetical protein